MDKVRAQGSQLAQVAQDAAREGKVKLDQAQAKRRADALFRDLGAAVYAERTGRGSPDSKERIDRLVDALSRQEADQGLGDTDAQGSDAEGSAAEGTSAESPSGESKTGESKAGENKAGENKAGESKTGESKTGGAGSNAETGGTSRPAGSGGTGSA
jgi:hypothetical protein